MDSVRTYEEKLKSFARNGRTRGFRIKLWKGQAKKVEKEGVILRDPKETDQKGQMSYEVDFSWPIPGTLSEELYEIACQNAPNGGKDVEPVEPLHPPYEI